MNQRTQFTGAVVHADVSIDELREMTAGVLEERLVEIEAAQPPSAAGNGDGATHGGNGSP